MKKLHITFNILAAALAALALYAFLNHWTLQKVPLISLLIGSALLVITHRLGYIEEQKSKNRGDILFMRFIGGFMSGACTFWALVFVISTKLQQYAEDMFLVFTYTELLIWVSVVIYFYHQIFPATDPKPKRLSK